MSEIPRETVLRAVLPLLSEAFAVHHPGAWRRIAMGARSLAAGAAAA
jgi:hypothetical protein